MKTVVQSLFVAVLALTFTEVIRPPAAFAKDLPEEPPMFVYLAKGGPNACGENCSEWIAAEGSIGPGSASRFRAVLARAGKRNLPVFFYSPGGRVNEALAIGRILRENGLTAGVGRTSPARCAGEKNEKECRDLKKSNEKLEADLQTAFSYCSSACVYILAGAKVRKVSPAVRLGVHAVRPIRVGESGRAKAFDAATLTPKEKIAKKRLG